MIKSYFIYLFLVFPPPPRLSYLYSIIIILEQVDSYVQTS